MKKVLQEKERRKKQRGVGERKENRVGEWFC
jgi:hypothetical protein